MLKQTLRYSTGHIDRADQWRKKPEWLAERLARPETMVVPVWRDRNLVEGLDQTPPAPMGVMYTHEIASRIIEAATTTVFLGLETDTAIFAADLSTYDESRVLELVQRGQYVDLRRAGPSIMKAEDAALMAYARGILYWHRHHRYCGTCGQETESKNGGHRRGCTNVDCGRETYPRTDPAVIMLVEYRPANGAPPQCLLGRHRRRLPPNVYSTLAGFVEPGESLEDAVAREVFEEVGVHIDKAIYQSSQPWPFPSSIMLGFRAQTTSTEIQVDGDELESARWFTAEEVRTFGEWGDESARFCLPRKDSIARFLVETWVEEMGRYADKPMDK